MSVKLVRPKKGMGMDLHDSPYWHCTACDRKSYLHKESPRHRGNCPDFGDPLFYEKLKIPEDGAECMECGMPQYLEDKSHWRMVDDPFMEYRMQHVLPLNYDRDPYEIERMLSNIQATLDAAGI